MAESKKLYSLEELSTKNGNKVYLLTMHFITWDYKTIEAIHQVLDIIDQKEEPLGLITTSSNPKVYSAGLNVKEFFGTRATLPNFLFTFQRLLKRFIQLGYPTIAAINGHCIAGGFIFAMIHDFRVQRKDYGAIQLNEINLGIQIPEGMSKVIEIKTKDKVLKNLIMGIKFSPEQSLKAELVDQIVLKEDLIEICKEIIDPFVPKSIARAAYASIKRTLFRDAILENDRYVTPRNGVYLGEISKMIK